MHRNTPAQRACCGYVAWHRQHHSTTPNASPSQQKSTPVTNSQTTNASPWPHVCRLGLGEFPARDKPFVQVFPAPSPLSQFAIAIYGTDGFFVSSNLVSPCPV